MALEAQVAAFEQEIESTAEQVVQLKEELAAAQSARGGELEAEAERYKQMLDDANAKHKRKMDELKKQSEAQEADLRNGFDQEKQVR